MTEATTTGGYPGTSSFIQIWVDSFAQVLAQVAPALFATPPGGAASPSPIIGVAEAPSEVPPANPADLWILGASSGRLRGELSLRVPAGSVLQLAGIFVGEAPVGGPSEPGPEQREAVVELMHQIAGFAATAAKAQWGEVQLRLDAAEAAPTWPASSTVWLRVGGDPATTALIEMHISAALAASLRTETVRTEIPPAEKPLIDTATTVSCVQSTVPAQQSDDAKVRASAEGRAAAEIVAGQVVTGQNTGKVQLDLLMDVELAVTLRFGSRRLVLREILDLNPGSVIELDRRVEEPVDMLLDGRVVARGDVVIMDGNYGLRVTEVAPA
jgi:flagellar motor switch protein FliN